MRLARSLAFQVYFFMLTLAMGLGALPLRLLRRKQAALSYAQLWSRLTLAGLCRICGISIEVTGHEHLPEGPCIIASQHQSYFDGFVWMNLVRKPAYIIKKELTHVPFVGPMLLLSGMIPVERAAGSKALRTLMSDAQKSFEDHRQVIIFPQGTRVAPDEYAPLQPGIIALAKQAKMPVIPVVTNSGLFWPRHGWQKRPGTLRIVIGPALVPDDQRGKLIQELSRTWETLETQHGLNNPVDKSVDAT